MLPVPEKHLAAPMHCGDDDEGSQNTDHWSLISHFTSRARCDIGKAPKKARAAGIAYHPSTCRRRDMA